jgi:hypothetical protein
MSPSATMSGTLHVERGGAFPSFLQFNNGPSLDGWGSIGNLGTALEEQMSKAGWICTFLAGKIQRTAFGFDRQKAFTAAMKKLGESVKSIHCNSFEMMDVTTKHFSGIFRVNVSAHARNFQKQEVHCDQ